MNKKSDKPQKAKTGKGLRNYPGLAENAADNNRVNEQLTRERTAVINNNPRNTDEQMP